MPLSKVNAVRYIASMREGGSMPALMEADDGAEYVVKLRGAGQGARPLAAELIVGEMARLLGLRVPRLVLLHLEERFGKTEPDEEVRELFQRSTGWNVGMEFLPGATMFDPAAGDVASPLEASGTVWLDAFVRNVDRTPRNTNLLVQDDLLWLIDHNAALIFHFAWATAAEKALSRFEDIRNHVLLPWATAVEEFGHAARSRLTKEALQELVSLVPEDFLPDYDCTSVQAQREGYLDYFSRRLAHATIFEEEIVSCQRACHINTQ